MLWKTLYKNRCSDTLPGCYKPITFDPDSSYCQANVFSLVLSQEKFEAMDVRALGVS